jgi:hypothetical protein
MRRVEGSLSGLARQSYGFGMPARRGMRCVEVVPAAMWNGGHGRREVIDVIPPDLPPHAESALRTNGNPRFWATLKP